LCTLFALLGALRLLIAVPTVDAGHVAYYNDTPAVLLEGVVVGEPDVRDRAVNLRVAARRLQVDGTWRDVRGTVLVQTRRYPVYAYGDVIRARGDLETPPVFEEFSYRDYLARQGVYSLMRRPQVERLDGGQGNPLFAAILRLKWRARATIAAIFPEPEASLLTGILLGVERGIPADVMEAFARTNTTHVIAISGFNITILAGLFAAIGGRLLGRQRATPVVLAGIALYTVLVGAGAAVVRAALMGGLYVVAVHYGRQAHALISMAVAAMLMSLLNPWVLWDVGFQLSFAATLGLILLTPPLQRAFERGLTQVLDAERARQAVRLLNDALIVTLAAQLATWPIMIYYFRQISGVGLLANLLILPAQPAVMILGGLATLAGLVWLPLGHLLAWVAWPFPWYTIRVVEQMARLPYAAIELPRVSAAWAWGYYGILGGALWVARQDPAERRRLWHALTERLSTKAALAGLSLVAMLVWTAAFSMPDGRLRVTFLDVGQGDAVLIETPGGRQVLVDGGPSPSALVDGVGRRLPFWDRSLDLVILTHPDEDHVGGLIPIVERYQVARALEPGIPQRSGAYLGWLELLAEKDVPTFQARTGLRISLGDGVWLRVLNPPQPLVRDTGADDNNNGVVLRLEYGQVAFLLTADIEAATETRLVAEGQPLQAQVLKVAHHGSDTSTTPAFLAAVAPWVAVVSVGADNRFGHPGEAVLARLAEANIPVYRTDQHGDIEFVTDGRRLWVRTGR
jgi:competence protein ComEC